MEIDTRFPIKLNTVSDAPEPLRSALADSLPSGEPVRLLVHAPAFASEEEKSPATVLAVTNNGWLVASATEGGTTAVEKSDFSDILFLEAKAAVFGIALVPDPVGRQARITGSRPAQYGGPGQPQGLRRLLQR